MELEFRKLGQCSSGLVWWAGVVLVEVSSLGTSCCPGLVRGLCRLSLLERLCTCCPAPVFPHCYIPSSALNSGLLIFLRVAPALPDLLPALLLS